MKHTVVFLPAGACAVVETGATIMDAMIAAGLAPDAPCGGKGTCGKCRVTVKDQQVLACQTPVKEELTVYTTQTGTAKILMSGTGVEVTADGKDAYVLAFDIGTTTVVAYLLDGKTGALVAQGSCMNPQSQFGADVISRIDHVLQEGSAEMTGCIRSAMKGLAQEVARSAGVELSQIGTAAIVGNTAMHHLLLDIDPRPLVTPPYMPAEFAAQERGIARIAPNIAGFVGGDTVGCMVSTRFDQLEELSLLIDIGTNGEMVLGDKNRRIACSTAAGPAFEGAKISCGMRGAVGAVDHVTLQDGKLSYHVIGDEEPQGLCGSGLLDLVSVLLQLGVIDESGCMDDGEFTLCENVTLTQKDVREVQLAKAAIRAGIELLSEKMGTEVSDIRKVFLAGAFGNYMDPASACKIGMIPPVLQDRIVAIGNAAGEGAKLCALRQAEFEYSKKLASETEFLELASLAQFQDCYVDALEFMEEEV